MSQEGVIHGWPGCSAVGQKVLGRFPMSSLSCRGSLSEMARSLPALPAPNDRCLNARVIHLGDWIHCMRWCCGAMGLTWLSVPPSICRSVHQVHSQCARACACVCVCVCVCVNTQERRPHPLHRGGWRLCAGCSEWHHRTAAGDNGGEMAGV